MFFIHPLQGPNISSVISPWAKSRYLTCQYHQREPHFNGTKLFRYIYSKYFFLLDIPNSQLKPANLHKQNGRRPKRVLPYIDHNPYHVCTPPPPPRNVSDLFYFVPGTCLNMKSGCHHHQIGMDNLWDAIFNMAAIKISGITFSPLTQFVR